MSYEIVVPKNVTVSYEEIVAAKGQPVLDANGQPKTRKAKRTYAFRDFIENRTEDPKSLATATDTLKACEARAAFAGTKKTVRVSNALYAYLKRIVEAPTGGYTSVMFQAMPFLRAILDAREIEDDEGG